MQLALGRWFKLLGLCVLTAGLQGCGEDPPLEAPLPDFESASFSKPSQIDNPYLAFVPETIRIYLGTSEDGREIIAVEALDEVRPISGIEARVVRDRAYSDGLLQEDTRDWYAQDDDGNVWYMGEATEAYEYDEDGNPTAVEPDGSWEAGRDVANLGAPAKPGHVMKANPRVGDRYRQEYYPGEAEDGAEVVSLESSVTLADGTRYRALETLEFTPLDPEVEEAKFYQSGVGLLVEAEDEERVELLGIFDTGPSTIPNFDAARFTRPATIDNSYLPLLAGAKFSYEHAGDEGIEHVEIEVTHDTREILGIACAIVHDRVTLDGAVTEDTEDWFAQDDAGNVWYMGETVDVYNYDEEGELLEITHEGSWEAGVDSASTGSPARPGVAMWATPELRTSYRQEYYAGQAEDLAFVVRNDARVELSNGTVYDDCLQILELNPFELGAPEFKYYAAGVGLLLEQELETGADVELVSASSN